MNGLSSKQVEASRAKYGDNKLPEKKLKTGLDFFLDTFKDKLNLILVGMMVIFAILAVAGQGSWSEPLGIVVVLLAIAIIGTKTGLKSQKSAKELKDKTSVHYCNVIRDGVKKHINTDEIVVGDVIIIQSGEAIYADGYLVDGNISVDNSVLNGESKECKKTPWTNPDAPFASGGKRKAGSNDYVNAYALFSGTTVLDGEGVMIVTHVGANTVNGQTIVILDEIEEQKTSLQIQLDDLADQISKFGYTGAAIIIAALLVSEILNIGGISAYLGLGWMPILSDILTIATTALTIVVAAVPEGLPLIISLITAQNAKTMIKHNVLAKHTNKIPEAGNIQLLCTDKTGTLTKGILEPVYNVDLNGNEFKDTKGTFQKFLKNICLNSSSMYDSSGTIVGGNATERALLTMTDENTFNQILSGFVVTARKSFNSANKYSAVQTDENGTVVTYYKGAPEKLLAAATRFETVDGEIVDIDKEKVQSIIDGFTNKAMRVIATGYSNTPIEESLPTDLIVTTLVAIRDDVRPEVPEAVEKMHKAGVQVMMVTGDVITTATAIAKDAGLIQSESDLAMSAIDFDNLSDEEAKAKLPYIKVIARATPNTKLRIVKLAQELGLCVGMTGDGTNDAPALKAADVGFSMGSGTDVCKEAGDIIITDDNFVSITDAVLLGRTFMHNVLKFLKFQLPINVSLVVLSVLYPVLFGIEAIAAVQILVINIVMDSLNSLSFGGEPPKDEYMLEKPIPKGSKLLDSSTVKQIGVSVATLIAIFGITCIPAVRNVFDSEKQYAAARFALLIIAATVNGFNIRTDGFNLFEGIGKNTMFIKIAACIFAGTFILTQFGGDFLHCTALTPIQWLVIVGLSLITIPVDMVRKYIKSKGGNK